MKPELDPLQSARRHIGVALIDLRHAAGELARRAEGCAENAALDALLARLHQDIDRLRALDAEIEALTAPPASALVALHWPDLVFRRAALHGRAD